MVGIGAYAALAIVFRKKQSIKLKKHIINIVFIVYILLLLSVTVNLFRGSGFAPENRANFVPLKSLIYALKNISDIYILLGLILNVILFIPFGFLLPVVFPKRAAKLWLTTLYGFPLSLFIELTQLLLPGIGRAFDVDDLIFNTLGAVVGYLLYLLCRKIFNSIKKKNN